MSGTVAEYVRDHSRHRGKVYDCLMHIALHARADGTLSYPSMAKLAKECRCTERSIRSAILTLESSGELIIERHRGRGNTHIYTVPMTPAVDIKPEIDDIKAEIGTGIMDVGELIKPEIQDTKTGNPEHENRKSTTGHIDQTRVNRPRTVLEPSISDQAPSNLFGDEVPKRKDKPHNVEEVADYIRELKLDPSCAEEFFDYNTSRGWMVGKSPCKDWKAVFRTYRHQRDQRGMPLAPLRIDRPPPEQIRRPNQGELARMRECAPPPTDGTTNATRDHTIAGRITSST